MKRMGFWLLPAALAAAAWAADFTPAQLEARFAYDLGPDTIDVSSYPDDKKKAYEVVKANCSRCHTLARPINAPHADAKTWKRYARRMHLKGKGTAKGVAEADLKTIVDFLAYDGQVRKQDKKGAFQAQAAELERLFAEVKKARELRQQKEGREKARESAPYTGTRVNP